MQSDRKLGDLAGIGKAMLSDFSLLGVRSVDELALADPDKLYEELCERTQSRQDPCVLDTFRCAVAQAKDPRLPKEQCNWWYWSRQRKAGKL
ncbi:MAG TPA: helix-hairpin-helix domain-containing protein [Bryobacteraceae bacterium]|nr:helix-hairpin-helix domain-containing protein [Bryobacteraceae bacterium]